MIIQYPNWKLPDLIRHIVVLFMLVAGGKSAGLVPVAGPALSETEKRSGDDRADHVGYFTHSPESAEVAGFRFFGIFLGECS
ncbi:hypothetical protein CEXT_179351 [Caerostris extrusa]|uniref:Uncharacterized protein n=1 Tax=Caerostris extrusa TaxID=172846 RepID=A0AAV4M6M7_CAEEX|nr:hypothetical protein CEXT_179351 [Caerostris extrusa]